MEEIEVVIKISRILYDQIQSDAEIMIYSGMRSWKGVLATLLRSVRNGTPLPKGHGKIGDLDKLIRAMKERNDDNGGEPLNAVDRGYDLAYQHMVKEAKECVIIEADKEGE